MNTPSNMKTSSMGRLLKGLIGLILFVLSLVIVIPIGAFIFFNPSDYKTQVSAYITEKSGLPLQIQGDIHLRYFPWLGLHVEDVRLPQASEFGSGDFISIQALEFKIPVTDIFKRQLIVESLTVKGLNIQLIKTKDGQTNWDYFSKQLKKNTTQTATPPQAETVSDNTKASMTTSGKKNKKISFALNDFNIQDAIFTLKDEAQQETISLSNLQLNGVANQAQAIPISGKFDIEQKSLKTNLILLSGHNEFQGKIVSNHKMLANINSTVELTFPQNPSSWQNVKADLNVKVDPANAISLKDISLHVGGLDIVGSCFIPLSDAPITFNVRMSQLNVDQLMNKPNPVANTPASQSAAPANQTPNVAASNSSSVNKARAIKGEVLIDKVIVKNLLLTNVKATVLKNDNLLKIAPLNASLYQGSLNAQVTKNLANAAIPTTLQGNLTNIQIQPLLTSFNQEHRLTGNADIDFNLSLASQLSGITKVKINNGTIRGIDVKYYLSVAQNLLNKEKNILPDNQTTSFGDLSATLNFHDNMVDNNDLLIQSADFKAKGEGSVYLGSKTIEYKLQAWRQYKDNKEHPNDIPLAIRIKGTFEHPKIEPDMDIYLKKGMEQEVKKQINKQIEKNIGKILGGSSDNTPQSDQTDGQTPDKSVHDQLQDKLEQKIDKGLKKLFKKKKEDQ